MGKPARASRLAPLSREVVLRTAVALADHAGIETVSMRSLAQELGVVPMALYKHVTNKEELLDGMVDVIVAEIDPPTQGARWKDTIRQAGDHCDGRRHDAQHHGLPEDVSPELARLCAVGGGKGQ